MRSFIVVLSLRGAGDWCRRIEKGPPEILGELTRIKLKAPQVTLVTCMRALRSRVSLQGSLVETVLRGRGLRFCESELCKLSSLPLSGMML